MIGRTMIGVPMLGAVFGALFTPTTVPERGLASRDEPPAPRLTFKTVFAGASPDGTGCVWEGSVAGATRGRLRIELRQVEAPFEAARPVWHVVTLWSVDDPSGTRSFEAELEGMVDWRTGVIQLDGAITRGWMQGAWVQQQGRLVKGDVTGSLVITTPTESP